MGLWCSEEVHEATFREVVEVLSDGAAGVEEAAVGVDDDAGCGATVGLVDVVEESFGCGDGLGINFFESKDFGAEGIGVGVVVVGAVEVAGGHDDGACADVVDAFDFFFESGHGVFGDDDLDADFWSVGLEFFESFEEVQVVVSFVDADVEVVDVLCVVFDGSFVEKMTVRGEEEVKWFGGGVLEDVAEVFSDEGVAAFEAEDDDAGVCEVVEDFFDAVGGEVECVFFPDVAKCALEAAVVGDFKGGVEGVDGFAGEFVLEGVA